MFLRGPLEDIREAEGYRRNNAQCKMYNTQYMMCKAQCKKKQCIMGNAKYKTQYTFKMQNEQHATNNAKQTTCDETNFNAQ